MSEDATFDHSIDRGSPRASAAPLARLGSTIQPGYDTSQGPLDEPDAYDPEEDYQRALQRQFQHRLRVLDRSAQSSTNIPGSSLLAKFKNPLGRSFESQHASSQSSSQAHTHSLPDSYHDLPRGSPQHRPVSTTASSNSNHLGRVLSTQEPTRSQRTGTTTEAFGSHPSSNRLTTVMSATTDTTSTRWTADGQRSPPHPRTSKATSGLPEETRDISQTIFIWRNEAKAPSSTKTFLPQVSGVTRKMTKRDRDHGSTHTGNSPSSHESGRLNQLAHNWLRERPSKSRLGTGSGDSASGSPSTSGTTVSTASPVLAGTRKDGSWKSGKVTFRDDGSLYIFGQEHTLLHAIRTDRIKLNQIRPIDDSLFGRANVVGIFSCPPVFAGRRHPTSNASSSGGASKDGAAADEPVYVAFPSSQKQRLWIALLQAWGQPEIYCHPHDVKRGGAHRWYRQIDATVMEYKSVGAASHSQSQSSAWSALTGSLPFSQSASTPSAKGKSASVDLPLETRRDAWMATSDTSLADAPQNQPAITESRPSLGSLHERRDSLSSLATTASGAEPVGDATADNTGDLDPTTMDDSIGTFDFSTTKGGPAQNGGADAQSITQTLTANVLGTNHSTPDLSPFTRGNAFKGKSSHKNADREGLQGRSQSPTNQFHSSNSFIPTAVYFLIYVNDVLAGRSSIRGADAKGAAFWPEKFAFKNLDTLDCLRVDVYQPSASLANSSSASGTTTTKSGKSVLIGSAEIPLINFRRGDEVQGFFPVWSRRTSSSLATNGQSLSAHAMSSIGAECVGQVKLSVKLSEEAVRLRRKYAETEELLNSSHCIPLIRALAKHFEEKPVVAHLIDIYTASGQIPDRLSDLVLAESVDFDPNRPELLFRDNSLLTRAVDQFQRLYCRDWLDASIGDQVRYVCENRIAIGLEDLAMCAQSAKKEHSTTDKSDGLAPGHNAGRSTPAEGSAVEILRSITSDLWKSIYANRHNCPIDLRRVLSEIRQSVNAKFGSHMGAPTGMQGVGAFVFLRLICPAITAPHLYGLVAFAPDAENAGKVLMLVAKILLGLANKRGAPFDADERPGLALLNDFLQQTAPAYDDYITLVSTSDIDPYASPKVSAGKRGSGGRGEEAARRQKGSKHSATSLRGAMADETDRTVRKMIDQKWPRLSQLHREAVASPPYLLDESLALASFVSFIARNTDGSLLEDCEVHQQSSDEAVGNPPNQEETDVSGGHKGDGNVSREPFQRFLDLCLDHEQRLGYYIDRAGFEPALNSLLQQEDEQAVKKSVPVTFVSTWKTQNGRGEGSSSGGTSSFVSTASNRLTPVKSSTTQVTTGNDSMWDSPTGSKGHTPSSVMGSPPGSPDLSGSPSAKFAKTSHRGHGSLKGRRATLSSAGGVGDESRKPSGGSGKPPNSNNNKARVRPRSSSSGTRGGFERRQASVEADNSSGALSPMTPFDGSGNKGTATECGGLKQPCEMPSSSSNNSMATVVPVGGKMMTSPGGGAGRRLTTSVAEGGAKASMMTPSGSASAVVASPVTPDSSNKSPRTRARASTTAATLTPTPPKRFSAEYPGWGGHHGGSPNTSTSAYQYQQQRSVVMGGLPWQTTTSTSLRTRSRADSGSGRVSLDNNSNGDHRSFGLGSVIREAATTASKSRKWWQRR